MKRIVCAILAIFFLATLNACGGGGSSSTGTNPTYACIDCHDSSGAKDISAPLARTYAHPVASEETHDSSTESSSAWGDGTFFDANRHVTCLDCHDQDYGATLSTATSGVIEEGSVLYGVGGVQMTSYPGKWLSTGAANFAYTDLAGFEYEICFKCHSSWAWGSNAPGTPGVPFTTRRDLAFEFNPNNGGSHNVVDSSSSGLGSFINGWTASSRVTCADCHGSSTGTDPAGPHGSDNPYMLKGAWTTATGSPGNISGHLCFNCHDPDVYGADATQIDANTGFKNLSSENIHARRTNMREAPCAACHGMVVHGWERPSMFVVQSDPLPYREGTYMATASPNLGPSGAYAESDCTGGGGGCH